MDKEWMLFMIKQRIDTLYNLYHKACDGLDANGKPYKGRSGDTRACKYKHDIQLLILIQELLSVTKALYINNEDAIEAFEKLIGDK